MASSHPRSARSTPGIASTAFPPPPNVETVMTEEPAPVAVLQGTNSNRGAVGETDEDVSPNAFPLGPRPSSSDGPRVRPSSQQGIHQTSVRHPMRKMSLDHEPFQRSAGSVQSHRPARFRDELDWDYSPEGRGDYPYYRDMYWRPDFRGDRYTRRGPRPPPAFYNGRRPTMVGTDSDEEPIAGYQDDYRYTKDPLFKDPFEGHRMRRMPDEEMGGAPLHYKQSYTNDGFGMGGPPLDWNNMSSREKAQVMRLPLTQWMNSAFKNHFVAALGELVGTTMFLFFAFAGTEVANIQSDSNSQQTTTGGTTGFDVSVQLYISFIFGFSLMVNVWVFFRISGGLFNPAVTLAMVLVKAITIPRAICLFVAQMGGGMLASVIVRYLFPETFNVRTTLGGNTTLVQGVFIEALLTAELVFTIFMLAKEKHRATFIAPVGIGLALFISEMAGVEFTGGSLNPARSFGPCVVTKKFDPEHWIYWVGPLAGSLIAVLFYRFIKTLEYEMANPGADGDDLNDPSKNPEKRAEVQAQAGKAPSILS